MITKTQVKRLLAIDCVEEVEDEGMDEGRFFVHLKTGYDWKQDHWQVTRTKSFGNYMDAHKAIGHVGVVK